MKSLFFNCNKKMFKLLSYISTRISEKLSPRNQYREEIYLLPTLLSLKPGNIF